jgi:predicted nucleotide-binding protein
MFNHDLADKIVELLNSAFPDKVQLDALRSALPQFSSVPESEWLKTLDALNRDGRVEFKGLRTGFDNTLQMAANIVISSTERRRLVQIGSRPPDVAKIAVDPEKMRRVWVVQGRDSRVNSATATFLLALGLKPVSFSNAREFTGKPMPHISEILRAAFEHAQAVVVLLTPDDIGRLKDNFIKADDQPSDTQFTAQPRLNVIFEAGMALVSHPEQTIFVRFGYVRPFSDIAGLHYVPMDGSVEQRRELALRLKAAGCPINLEEEHWLKAGDFSPDEPRQATGLGTKSNLMAVALAYITSLQMEWEGQKAKRPVLIGPLWQIVDRASPALLDLHTKALAEGSHGLAATLADSYQAFKRHEGDEELATLDYNDASFIADIDDAIARLKSGVGAGRVAQVSGA